MTEQALTTLLSKHTKIVCTLGPATHTVEVLSELIGAGMNVARLNFSHGDHKDHKELLDMVREASTRCGISVSILLDIQGPRIRLGKFEGEYAIAAGDKLVLTTQEKNSYPEKLPLTYDALHDDVLVGQHILIADGTVDLVIEKLDGRDIHCVVEEAGEGVLISHKGLNIPEAKLSLSTITEKDKEDLKFGVENGVDYISLSFVRGVHDVLELKGLLQNAVNEVGGDAFVPKIIPKIERREAVDQLSSIVKEADGIMVARGDLGIELPATQVPVVQKDCIELCLQHAKPCIVATQMLDSMIRNPRPTRAEVSDVAHAVMDHTDAVMLSGETSVGKYPIAAVATMRDAAHDVEVSPYDLLSLANVSSAIHDVHFDTARSVAEQIEHGHIDAIVVATESGYAARLIARFRPHVPILALTSSLVTYRQLALVWGVIPYFVSPAEGGSVWDYEDEAVSLYGFGKPKKSVILVTSSDLQSIDKIDRTTMRTF